MSVGDEVFSVFLSLLIRVWEVVIRVSYAYEVSHTHMGGCLAAQK